MRCALEEWSTQNRGGCDRRTPRSTGRWIAWKKSLSHHQQQPDDSDQDKAECTGLGYRADGSNHHVAGQSRHNVRTTVQRKQLAASRWVAPFVRKKAQFESVKRVLKN